MREVKVAAVQFESTADIEQNRRKALRLCEDAARGGAQAVCLPEFWLTGNPTRGESERLKPLAEPVPGPTFDVFCKTARELRLYIVPWTVLEIGEDHQYYNTSGLIAPDGTLMARLRKDHPEDAPGKAEVECGIRPGPGEYPVFETPLGRIGVPIDVDMCAIEVPRIMGLKGAEILFWPLCWGATVHDAVAPYAMIASTISAAYVVASNRVGAAPLLRIGGSGVFWLRDYVARVPNLVEGVTVATLDLDLIKARREDCRRTYPFWRRPSTYRLLVDEEIEKKRRGSTH